LSILKDVPIKEYTGSAKYFNEVIENWRPLKIK
jgi:hypothetical protein